MSGSLGFAHQGSRSSSDSQMTATGISGSESGDTSRSMSSGISGGQSQSTSGQTIAFQDLYNQLYGNAGNAANNVAMQAPQLQQAAQQLFTGGTQFLQTLGSNPGTDYQNSRLNGTNPAIDDIIKSMQTDAGNLFTQQLNPAITANAVAGGTLGGGRQGVAQGVAQGQVADSFIRNAANVRLADVANKDAIAANVAGNSIAAAGTGLGALPGMLDIMERGQNAELAPYSSLAQILGGPTTLSSSESTASDFSRNTAQAAADAFSRAFGQQTQQSTATSRGSSHGFDYSSSFAIGGMGGGGGG